MMNLLFDPFQGTLCNKPTDLDESLLHGGKLKAEDIPLYSNPLSMWTPIMLTVKLDTLLKG